MFSLVKQSVAGLQILFVAFGAMVLVPLLTGLNPSMALLGAGVGTLLFQLATGRQVPVFLASSFAFIAPILAAKGEFGLPAVLGGVVAAGFVYIILGLAVKLKGPGFIDRILPPVVIGPVIMAIGLALSPVAVNMAMGKTGDGAAELVPYQTAMLISMPALVTTVLVAVLGKGIFRLVPILAGIAVGCTLALLLGVIDTAAIAAAPWLASIKADISERLVSRLPTTVAWMSRASCRPATEFSQRVRALAISDWSDWVADAGA